MNGTAATSGSVFREGFTDLVRARFPLIYVTTYEEERLLDEVSAALDGERLRRRPRQVLTWHATRGLGELGQPPLADTRDPLRMLEAVAIHDAAAVFVLFDLHLYLRETHSDRYTHLVRRLRELRSILNRAPQPKSVVIVAPTVVLPEDLQKDVYLIELGLPTGAEIQGALDRIKKENQGTIEIHLAPDDEEQMVKAALGLTLAEADNAFALAMAHDDRLDRNDIAFVIQEKRQAIKRMEILEFVTEDRDFAAVGGLDNLKQWLHRRKNSWRETARDYGLPFPKGVLITGVPGCGKSLTARCTSALWALPLIRLDMGRIFAGLVGSSEANMRNALQTAEAVAPCILWIDEVEKGFARSGSGAGDSGVSSRVFGTFLTWMQEKEAPVFVMATANDVAALPPEFLRKGRFDEIFFVDLPTLNERIGIWRIHLVSKLRSSVARGDLPLDDRTYVALAEQSEGYTGSEIEQAVVSAMYESFAEGRSVDLVDLAGAVRNTVALSQTAAEEIKRLRDWANVRAVAATSSRDRVEYSADGEATDTLVRGGRTIGI